MPKKTNQRFTSMEEKTYQSLLNILDYLKDEQEDFEAMERPKNHIYLDIKRLSKWANEVAEDK